MMYCVMCEEAMEESSMIMNVDSGGFLTSGQQGWSTIYYCINKKCLRVYNLTIGGVLFENLKRNKTK